MIIVVNGNVGSSVGISVDSGSLTVVGSKVGTNVGNGVVIIVEDGLLVGRGDGRLEGCLVGLRVTGL